MEELSRVLMAIERKLGDEAFRTTYFYYGNGLLAQENEKEGYLTYHFNNVGSTNAVTDENGAVKYTYAYNPYGELTKGSFGQVMFLFNGQYGVASDDNGLYYMRARYYNVSIKRFINQDVMTGSIAESQSLNRYAYVEGNPVSYFDPFGLEKVDTSGMHLVAGLVGAGAFVIGVLATGDSGLAIGAAVVGAASSGFDAGLYINDAINADTPKEAFEASKNAALNIAGIGAGAAYESSIGANSKLMQYAGEFKIANMGMNGYNAFTSTTSFIKYILKVIEKKLDEYWERKKDEYRKNKRNSV